MPFLERVTAARGPPTNATVPASFDAAASRDGRPQINSRRPRPLGDKPRMVVVEPPESISVTGSSELLGAVITPPK